MFFSLITLLLCVGNAFSVSSSSLADFNNYVAKYNKAYDSSEYDLRFDIFRHNNHLINAHNAARKSWTLAINEWTDRTWDEFISERRGRVPVFVRGNSTAQYVGAVQDAVDWRGRGVVNPVKDQGSCGSCYAFSAISAVESAYAIKTGKLYNLSEQQIVDCSGKFGNGGCSGGLMRNVFNYGTKVALCPAHEYPYVGKAGKCAICAGVVQLKGFKAVQPKNETALQYAAALQPISVAVEADQVGFQFYSAGVFDGACGTNLDHGVVIDGYGTDKGKAYWLVRNSWGNSWGENGYIRLARGRNQCGIALQATYPIVL